MTLLPTGGATDMQTARGMTAIRRTAMSRPVTTALRDGVVDLTTTVLDYGCGRGTDVRSLRTVGVTSTGWDPIHQPDADVFPADVVNLGFVVNVIEDPQERVEVLRRAWSLATKALVVAARLKHEQNNPSLVPLADGWLTSRNTFQKFYDQEELREWVQASLGEAPCAAAPGVFYVFRNESDRQAFLVRRIAHRRALSVPRPALEDLFERHRESLDPFLSFFAEHGRVPEASELELPLDVVDAFGSFGRVSRAIAAGIGEDQWILIRARRSEQLLVYLALSRLSGRPRFGELSAPLQRDIRSLFGSYSKASEQADELLFSAGDMEVVRRACATSAVGKVTAEALYVHTDALDELPAVLRIYEGCARTFIGSVERTTIVKLRFDRPMISYLEYPAFDRDPHPVLASSVVVPLHTFDVTFHDYTTRRNPPILHRKELFVGRDYPTRAKFERLTRQEERWGLLADTARIGTRHGWELALAERGARLMGHRVVRANP